MSQNMYDLNNKIYSNNNNLLLEIINDLQQVINNSHENLTIKRIGDIMNKMNYIINDNKKNTELIIKHISLLQNQINKRFDKLEINNMNNQEIKQYNGRYVGQVVNGLKEGKGIFYFNDGDICEGDWRNGKMEGKGIYYYNKSGNRYESDFRNNKKEGKGIFYYNNGDREIGDYLNGKKIGKHAYFSIQGEISIKNYT